MDKVEDALDATRAAVSDMIAAAEGAESRWNTPRAPGKWSPAQVIEHVSRSFEESANVAAGRPSKFPKIPALMRPLLRRFFLQRVLASRRFPKARTNRAMDPVTGPASTAEGRVRLQMALSQFEEECRKLSRANKPLNSLVFGTLPIEDYIVFQELHTRHHTKQI